ncbi:MAG: hypothetical protein IPI57_07245 [Candidatus Competibacteraceae bacterium]|nr:hypothetical protein [Candidatus Competibacteraceae bacterium]
MRREYHQLIAADAGRSAGLAVASFASCRPKTKAVTELPLYAKGRPAVDIGSARACGTDGIGLYPFAEFAFMLRDSFPSTDEQCAGPTNAGGVRPRRVVIRTLDIGGDKCLPYFSISGKEIPFSAGAASLLPWIGPTLRGPVARPVTGPTPA